MERKKALAESGICLLSKLKEKEVVSVDSGKRLGRIADVEVSLEEERIMAIVLQADGGRVSFFQRQEERVIAWEKIVRVGEDVVLVRGEGMVPMKEKRSFRLLG